MNTPALTHRDQPFRAPDDPDDTEEYRRILEYLRAMDAANDDEPDPRQAHSKSPRHAALAAEFAPLMEWGRLREAVESSPVGSNWMLATGDPAAPKKVEAGNPNDWTESSLIEKASLGVRWHQVGGRLVPADGQLEYSKSTGRLIRCGALILADELDPANDDLPEHEPADGADKVEIIGGVRRPTERVDEDADPDDQADDVASIFGRALRPSEDLDRGRRDSGRVYAGSIVGILHRTGKSDKFVVLKEPRNAEGRFRIQKKRKPEVEPKPPKRPPEGYVISPDDRIDSQVLVRRLLPYLSGDAVRVLDFALRAANLAEIGEVFGKSGKHAERVGRQKLIDACAEFVAAQEKLEEFDRIRQQALAA